MEQFKFKIVNIKIVAPDEFDITINVWDKNEVTTVLENLSSESETELKELTYKQYTFTLDPIACTMSLFKDKDLEECFDTYNKYEFSTNLNPRLRRHWKTANIVDNLTDYFLKNNYFNNKLYNHLDINGFDE